MEPVAHTADTESQPVASSSVTRRRQKHHAGLGIHLLVLYMVRRRLVFLTTSATTLPWQLVIVGHHANDIGLEVGEHGEPHVHAAAIGLRESTVVGK